MSAHELSAVLGRWIEMTDTPLSIAVAGDEGGLVYVNPAFEATSGYPAADLLGRGAGFLQVADQTRGDAVRDAARDASRTGRPTRARVLSRRADGTTWWSELHLCPVGDETGTTHLVELRLDITDQVAAEQQNVHAATHDGLTDLATRSHFMASLERELARAARDHSGVAVLFLDVDNLKATNDQHGHGAGDALLVEVANRLRARLRSSDLAGRYGGDEFLVLLVQLPEDPAEAAAGAATVADELRRSLAVPVRIGDATIALSVSIGASRYPGDATTALDLVHRADAAMYRQKAAR